MMELIQHHWVEENSGFPDRFYRALSLLELQIQEAYAKDELA